MKNGHNYKGAQKFWCKACGRYRDARCPIRLRWVDSHIIHHSVRERLDHFPRKTLGFSKRDNMHEGVLRLFLQKYKISGIS